MKTKKETLQTIAKLMQELAICFGELEIETAPHSEAGSIQTPNTLIVKGDKKLAEIFGVSTKTIQRQVKAGLFKKNARKIGRCNVYVFDKDKHGLLKW